jgi:hypothetical protein
VTAEECEVSRGVSELSGKLNDKWHGGNRFCILNCLPYEKGVFF